ncbi:ATP-binding protein, partial [Mediterraneibacter glycyrrhizinilyticus]
KKAQLVIIDEIGYTPISRGQANRFFTFISDTYETSSIIFTTNVNNGELVPSARSNCTTLPKQEYHLAGWLYRSATVLCQRCEPL